MADSVRRTLSDAPQRWLSPKWLYDELGSVLFDAITRVPHYYPTSRERAILEARSGEVATLSGADTLVELGSGTSDKTRLLLDAFTATGQLQRFCPLDVSATTLAGAAEAIGAEHPHLEVVPVVGDFLHDLGRIPAGGRRLVVFLGGTIGNLTPPERAKFLGELADQLQPGDWLLLGTDLVKDPDRLVRAYDDGAGVTAEFNRNVLRVLNRELDGDLVPERFGHVARWDPDEQWIEMHLRSEGEQQARLDALDLDLDFADGELVHTEISAKFTRGRIEGELAGAGLELDRLLTDQSGDFAVSLSRKP
jgi:dimethylhistidine N-methyltransferase